MNYRKIPNSKDKLSILGFGCMRFPIFENGKIDEEKAKEMILFGVENGINYIDTAWGYHNGESEPLVGKIVEENNLRDKVYLATKLPSYLVQKKGDLEYFFNEQLKRLRTDRIDYYLIHTLNVKNWKNVVDAGIFDFMDKVKKEGKVRHIGFSFHDEFPLFKTIVDSYNWDFCMIQYNYLDIEYQAGKAGLDYAYSKGMGVFVMEPLRGGALVNNISTEIMNEWENSSKKYTPAQWGLRWVWNHENVTLLLSGMSNYEQVKENLETASSIKSPILNDDDLERVRRVRELYKKKIKVNCTRCNYCMPCRYGIDIPGAFNYYNNSSMFSDITKFKKQYSIFVKEEARASKCRKCGRCEPKCPQGIKIMTELKNAEECLEN